MFARVKQSRQDYDYLQIVENYRDGDRVRQRLVFYVGHYDSIDDALERMPQERRRMRSEATRTGNENLRRDADALDARLDALRRLVEDHPDLVERDRERRERRERRDSERIRARKEAEGPVAW